VAELAPDLPVLLDALLGSAHLVDDWLPLETDPEPGEDAGPDASLVWMRDYQPIFVRAADGSLEALTYLSLNPNRSGRAVLAEPARLSTRVLPILHENGNLVTNGRKVFVTDRLIDDNDEWIDAPHLLRAGYRPRGRGELIRLLAAALRRQIEDVIVLPQMPYESTGHADVFLLALAPDTFVVPSIEPSALARSSGRAHDIGQVIRVFLDEQAEHVASLGFEVIRAPMLAPGLLVQGDDDADTFELLLYTPANTLLVTLLGRRVALYPSFARPDDAAARALAERYAARWERTLRAHGWEPFAVRADELVAHMGLCRCVTAAVPL
jgi:hypothetical protein